AIHGSLITPTPKHYSLTLCKNQLSQLESLEQLQKYATDWQTTLMVETQCASFVASAPGMAQRPNRVRKTRRGKNDTSVLGHTHSLLVTFACCFTCRVMCMFETQRTASLCGRAARAPRLIT